MVHVSIRKKHITEIDEIFLLMHTSVYGMYSNILEENNFLLMKRGCALQALL